MNLNSQRKSFTHRIILLIFMITGFYLVYAFTPPGESDKTETANYQEYIKTYAKKAILLKQKYKIPASIVLAQALLESAGGQGFLALAGNNHFGLKCTDWQGLCINKSDDGTNACFRKYLSVNDSFEDYSRFLTERKYYKSLFQLKLTDYKAWAAGLQQCGYATDPQYATKLIGIIEKFKLYQYDNE